MPAKKKGNKPSLWSRIAASFKGKAFRIGSYSAVTTAIVVAIVVLVNLMVGAIPSQYTKIDTTDNALFTISEQTEKIVRGLTEDVTIYWVVQSGYEYSLLEQLLDRYTSLSSHLKVVKRDPVVYPNFVSQYTTQSASNNSLVVVNGDRSKYIAYEEIVVTDYSNYYYDGTYTSEFAGENAITSALDYVTSDSLPKLYTLTGHGESALPTDLESAIARENMVLEELSLLPLEAVPEDADAVLLIAPQSDLSEAERDKLLAYLEGGGSMLLITDYVEGDMPNLAAVAEHYGVTATDGIVVEGDQNYVLWGYQHYLLPDLSTHAITAPLRDGNYYVLMPVAQGLQVASGLRDTLSVTQLLTTSYSAYSKIAGYDMQTFEKEEGDIDGPFALGVAAEETTSGGTTHFVWFSSAQMLASDANQTVGGANYDAILNALGWMCERENSISIHSKSLMADALLVPTGAASTWSIVLIGVIPAVVLAIGILIAVRRRRK